ncbi:hypothetical protein MtrunA17_Chr4g0023511 [Medicago truncatula]|uniref:Uncharacterized protein n=1 Tax=Medicago truncatula TaxID=3880 RepID=A0A396I3M0_MEDTR|nr:hypothetical protein MtrunA17_Chr4g0023511 [Medicago truncatula]
MPPIQFIFLIWDRNSNIIIAFNTWFQELTMWNVTNVAQSLGKGFFVEQYM